MGAKTEGYVDTSALIAFADRSDTYHIIFRRLFADPPSLITTGLVVAEGHAWFLRRFDRTRALQFLAMIEAMKPMKIASVGPREQKGATELLRKFPDQNLTLTDAVGLHLMNYNDIPSCWSTDW